MTFLTVAIFMLGSLVFRSFAASGMCRLRKSQSPLGYRVASGPQVPLSASIPAECSSACNNSTNLLDSCVEPACLCSNSNGQGLQTCMNCLYNLTSSSDLSSSNNLSSSSDGFNMVQTTFNEFSQACLGYPVARLSVANQTSSTVSSSSVSASSTSNATSSINSNASSTGTLTTTSLSSSSSSSSLNSTTSSTRLSSSSSSSSTSTSTTRSSVSVVPTKEVASSQSRRQLCRLKK